MVQPDGDAGGASAAGGAGREHPARRGSGPARERAREHPARRGQAPRRGSVAQGGEGGARLSTTPAPEGGAGFELLEHTADVGIRAHGATQEEAFERATLGLAEVQGALVPGPGEPAEGQGERVADPGEPVAVQVSAADPGGLLVDWLNEVLWLTETRQAGVVGVRVDRVGDGVASGSVVLDSGGPAPDGTFVKAVTYHRLRVEPDPAGGWLVEVYLDV